MMLDRFDCYSPGARRLYHFEGQEEQAQLTAEVRRTLEAAASGAQARIAKGSLTRDEAARLTTLWLAIAEDLEVQDRWLAGGRAEPAAAQQLRELRARNGVAWSDKVTALRSEIEARRTGYPAEIAKGRLTPDEAKRQLDAIEAVHDLYWRHGYAFDGTREESRAMSGPILDSYEFTAPKEATA